MNRMHLVLLRGSRILLLPSLLLTPLRATAQQSQEIPSHPPASFSAEDDKFPGAVPLPECVRNLLASDRHVLNPRKYEQLSPEQLPADWFTAAEQDLGQSRGALFVVMGARVRRGANINPFWIFQRTSNSWALW